MGCCGGMFVYAIPRLCTQLDDSNAPKVLKLLQQFDKFHIDINNQSEDADYYDELMDEQEEPERPLVRRILLQISDVLHNKSVLVKFINSERSKGTGRVKEQLAELMLIRCNEFKILNTGLPAPNIATLTAVVTSDRPILDLYKMLENFKDYCEEVHSACSCLRFHDRFDCCQEDMWQLDNAVGRWDAEEFFKLRADLIGRIDGEMKRLQELRNQVLGDIALDKDGLPTRMQKEDDSQIEDEDDEEDDDEDEDEVSGEDSECVQASEDTVVKS